MLNWCAYCQQFQGETEPYEELQLTHGICETCESSMFADSEPDLARVRFVAELQGELAAAGRRGDVGEAEAMILRAARVNLRPVDVLVGLLAPLLFEIGRDWERGAITVADEHRFSNFCERVYAAIVARTSASGAQDSTRPDQAHVFLVNAPGNRHTLGIRLLALWLASHGVDAHALLPTPPLEALLTLVRHASPRALLVSVALPEQRSGVLDTAARIAAWPEATRPRLIVGGHAIKLGLVAAIPGAELMTDIGPLLRSLATRATVSGAASRKSPIGLKR